MKNVIYLSVILFFGVIIGCKEQVIDDHHGHSHDHGGGGGASEEHTEVKLAQEQLDIMGVTLGGFKEMNLSSSVKANGMLELPPQNKASLSAITAGRVKTISVIEGEEVSKGQILTTIENPDFIDMQEEYLSAKSQFDFMEKEQQRNLALFEKEVISKSEFQEVESDFFAAKASFNASEAEMKLLGINIESLEQGNIQSSIALRSPIAGHVRLIEVNIGKYVLPETEMFEIVDNEHIHVDLLVYEKDLGQVKEDQKIVFSLAAHPDKIYEGNVFAVGSAFEEDTRAVRVHAEIINSQEDLLPGMYVDARIITEDNKVLALPQDAFVNEKGLDYIFVKAGIDRGDDHGHDHAEDEAHDHEDETPKFIFKKVQVSKGLADVGYIEAILMEDIPKTAIVVIDGAYYLLAEMDKNERGHMH